MATVERDTLTVTLRRPLTIANYGNASGGGGCNEVLPAGSRCAFRFHGTGGMAHLQERPATEVHILAIREAAAMAPCPYAETESDGDDYTWYTYSICHHFDGDSSIDVFRFCQADACRCPSSKVRAEAKAALAKKEPDMEPVEQTKVCPYFRGHMMGWWCDRLGDKAPYFCQSLPSRCPSAKLRAELTKEGEHP